MLQLIAHTNFLVLTSLQLSEVELGCVIIYYIQQGKLRLTGGIHQTPGHRAGAELDLNPDLPGLLPKDQQSREERRKAPAPCVPGWEVGVALPWRACWTVRL